MNSDEQSDILEITRRVVAEIRPDELEIVSPALLTEVNGRTSGLLGFGSDEMMTLLSPLLLLFLKILFLVSLSPWQHTCQTALFRT